MSLEIFSGNYTILQIDKNIDAVNDARQSIGLLFDYIQDETSSVEADITDNWVESNYTLQDHIAIKPRVYRLRGCVGEVVFENQWAVVDAVESLNQTHPVLAKTIGAVNNLAGIAGIVGNYTQAAMNIAKQVESSVNRYVNGWRNFTGQNQYAGRRQKEVYAILQSMLRNRQPVKITKSMMYDYEAPDDNYEKLYYLQSVSAHQGDNAFITDIEVTIKEFRVAVTKTTKVDRKKLAGFTAVRKAAQAESGNAKGTTVAPETAKKAIQISSGDLEKASKGTITPLPPKNPLKRLYLSIQEKTASYNQQSQKARELGFIK